jgi:cytidylate kinase
MVTQPVLITIDGPAGAGKSTLGQQLARRLGYLYFDTGVLYRALTWAALEHQVALDDETALVGLARRITIDVQPPSVDDGRQYSVLVDGRDVTWELRQPIVEQNVSKVARYPAVREVLRARQRAIGHNGRVVMVGRDIGSVVMPDAPFKVYLVASLEERARRRAADAQARGLHVGLAEIRADIERRDALDSHVMSPAPDAMIISSDGLSPEQVVDLIVGHFPVR